MGAKFTICCCRYLKHNQEERNAILRLEKLLQSQLFTLYSSSYFNIPKYTFIVSYFYFFLSRLHSTPRPLEQLSSGSSDSETEEKNIFGPPPSKTSQWKNQQSQRSTADQRAIADRAENTPISQGLDGELQAFISMRDQTDEATEVTENMLYTTDAEISVFKLQRLSQNWEKTHIYKTICSHPGG